MFPSKTTQTVGGRQQKRWAGRAGYKQELAGRGEGASDNKTCLLQTMKDKAVDESKTGRLKRTKVGSKCRQDGQQMTQRGEGKRDGYFYHFN